jgi:arginine-tRNA-protein transferase
MEMMTQPQPPMSCAYPAWSPPVAVRLVTVPEHPCAYLPQRTAQTRAFWADHLQPAVYEAFMDAGFRRSGKVIYQPTCRGCRACLPIRIPVGRFVPNKSQRRSLRRNADLTLAIAAPHATAEKYELYARYTHQWHAAEEVPSWDQFLTFLYDSPVQTLEMCYRDGQGRLLGVGICDVGPRALSSVYFYFEPRQSSRSLGTYSALQEIDIARARRLPYYYLGYWVRGCRAMEYKANYHPHQVLQPDGRWLEEGEPEQ